MKCRRCNELHSHAWHPRGQRVEEPWGDLECDDAEPEKPWWDEVDDHTFHLAGYHGRRGAPSTPMKRVVCRGCGGDRFQVGSGEWVTAIKCVNCGWERVIHDG